MNIRTEYDPLPEEISREFGPPNRNFNWSAWDDDRGEDFATAYGPTEEAAIAELMAMLEEREE